MKHHLSEIPGPAYLPRPAVGCVPVMYGLYCLARAYILADDFISLRQLPKSVLKTVPWTQYLLQI